MKYISTRGAAAALNFENVLLTGLARDGGLYVPETWPTLNPTLAGKSYAEIADSVMAPFVAPALSEPIFKRLVREAYHSFTHKAVTPLRQIDERHFLLELFHGPTLAFKDVALQLLGQLFDHVLETRQEQITILGATSGDTGSAAIAAFEHSTHADVFILLPHERISEVQRRQMTTVAAPHIHVLAIEGSFDDCQTIVKTLFSDLVLRDKLHLSAVNSINWGRIMAQTVYYVYAALTLGAQTGRKIAFAVPTGNFGNVYAGYCARQMGLPIERLIIASNKNDIVPRLFNSGLMKKEGVHTTLSPAMDIQISSNLERLLYDIKARDSAALAATMTQFNTSGEMRLSLAEQTQLTKGFEAHAISDVETLATIRAVYQQSELLIDPHTAVALEAAKRSSLPDDVAIVTLATAHPAKFPDAVEKATGIKPTLPASMAEIYDRPERQTILPNDAKAVRAYLETHARCR